ncbi:MAG: GIY-YIG nuclease family protein [Rhizobiales bacterium]|nr:GIY-YIG nuclease family protein [Hyphomicrobiales bacterium]
MLAIENFGRRWRRDKVHWGAGSNKGHLRGFRRGAKLKSVDFRTQIGIYVLFNAAGNAVYVGQAGLGNARLFSRLKAHTRDHLRDRWTHFSWFGLRGVNAVNNKLSEFHKPETRISGRNRRDALHETEAVVMSVVEPPLNKRGPNWQGSREYKQYVEDGPKDVFELTVETAIRLRRIEAMLQKIHKE